MAHQRARTSDSSQTTVIGIVGDRDAKYALHPATENALRDGPGSPTVEWIPTEQVSGPQDPSLRRYAGLLIAPGSHRSVKGILAAIRYARENHVPLLGTCGGFQHLVVEFARSVGGLPDADHEETSPGTPHLVVTALECSLVGQTHPVQLVAATKAAAIYASREVMEPFYCNYGLNADYRPLLELHGLTVSGIGKGGEARIVELSAHPFFIGTLYVPQARHELGNTHPLIRAFVAAARARPPPEV